MKKRKLLISILTGLCVCLTSATLLTACKDEHTHSYTQQTTTEATCTEKGVITFTCSCNDTYMEEIPALGHDEETHQAQAPTCTEIGWEEYVTCQRESCQYTTYVEIPALTHDKGQHDAQAATCTAKGWDAYETCSRCDYTTYTEIPSLDHDKVQHDAQAATCTAIGWDAYETCTRCDYTTYAEIDALDHDKVQHDAQAATCTEKGWEEYEDCTRCEYTTYVEIPALDHEFTNYIPDNNATYTSDGTKTATCNRIGCNETHTITDEGTMLASGIVFKTLSVNGTDVYGKVSNETETFSFINEVQANGTAKYVVSLDIYGIQQVATKTIPLSIGDNTVYITETVNDEPINIYTVTVRRRPMYNVTFDTNGGTSVQRQIIEEDYFASEPTTTRTGYTFTGWNYDFTQPITQNTIVKASWTANTDTPYTVEYYLQNLENDEYTLQESVELIRETDTTATAEIKEYTHFTYNESASTISGNINGDGSCVLNVYYTRNTYTLSINDSSIGSITNVGTYKYGMEEFTTTATPTNLGYSFLGWYSGEELLSTNLEYTFMVDKNVMARFAVKAEMSNFNFTSTATMCSITSIKDKTVSQIVVPNYVTSISKGAFSGCPALKSITIPFIGATKGGTENTHLGYIFGASSYSDNSSYVPTSLNKVTITGGNIGYSAFFNCDSLTSVVIGDSVASIGEYAFVYCDSLTSVVIGDSVASIGEYAFSSCDSLTNVYITDLEAWCNILFGNSSATPLSYAENLYLNNELVTELVIPDAVTKIKAYTFCNCDSLTSVEIGDSVTSIGEDAFRGCSSLTEITLPFIGGNKASTGYKAVFGYIFGYTTSSNSSISGATCQFNRGSTYYHYYIPTSLKKVTITGGAIGPEAFNNCNGLTSVVIGDSVTSIGVAAFSGCTSLTEIVIPDSVTSIGNYAFQACSSLTEITLPFVGMKKDGASYTHFGYIFGASSYSDNSFYVPTSLNKVTITGGNIGERAFYGCSNLTSVVIGDSVTSIGSSAFSSCSSLTSVVIGDSVTSIGSFAFSSCSSLTSVVIGDSVTTIGEEAFFSCDSLTSVEIGDGVTTIGEEAFFSCDSLTSMTVDENNTTYKSIDGNLYTKDGKQLLQYAIGKTDTKFIIPDSVTSIGSSAFYNCYSLTSVVIPDSVTWIGSSAFEDCYRLVEVVNKSPSITVTKGSTDNGDVGYYALTVYNSGDAFTGTKLSNDNGYIVYTDGAEKILVGYNGCETDLILPSYITQINRYAFRYCYSLTSVVIGDSVTTIGDYAFEYCYKLVEVVNKSSSITVTKGSSNNGYVGYYALLVYNSDSGVTESQLTNDNGYIVYTDGAEKILVGYNGCETDLILPSYITQINRYAFFSCDSLTSVVIGDSVTSIGSQAFSGCDSLVSIVIPDRVTSIGEGAFSGCDSLTSVVIGDSVTSIGDSAFSGCRSLTSVVIGDSVTSIGWYAFYNCTSLTSVDIGDSVTSIGWNAFRNCSSLTSVVIPDSVTSIGSYAFQDCNSLTIYCEAASKPSGWSSSWNFNSRPVVWGGI